MKQLRTAALLLMTIAIFTTSCKKHHKHYIDPDTSYTFTNNLDKAVNIRLWDVNDNSFKTYLSAPAHGSVKIPLYYLFQKDGYTPRTLAYYWANSDYTMSSWYTAAIEELVSRTSFGYVEGRKEYNIDINSIVARDDLYYCEHELDGAITWFTVNAYDSMGNSIWNTLTPEERNYSFNLQYNRTGTLYHGPVPDSIKSFRYGLDQFNPYFSLDILTYTTRSGVSQACDIVFTSHMDLPFMRDLTGRDSVYMIINGRPPYYVMRRTYAID